MKQLFLTLAIGNFLVDILSYVLLPASVATHFGASGMPNGWFSSTTSLVFNLVLHGLFFIIFYSSSHALFKMPKELISLPNKDYWLSDENLPAVKAKWESLIFLFGSGLMAFFLAVSLMIINANFANPAQLNTTAFISALILFLLFLVYWIFLLYRAFRLPK